MDDWTTRDLRHNWHPYTQMSALHGEPPLIVERAEGVRLYDSRGRMYYDTISSWWCNIHGHCHPRIIEAISSQVQRLDHVLFAAVAHEGAIRLAERLTSLAGDGLERVFYSDDGSTAVEVALKMSLQYWRNRGRHEKKRFICLERGYHGDTIGCMSVSGVELFRNAFDAVTFEAIRVPCPYCYRCPLGLDESSCGCTCADLLADALEANARETAALIMEPLLMAAGGMIVYPAEYLSRASQLAREYDVHLILDEVATGFGRTGTMFACERAGVSPDLMCLSKGITSGVMPFAATLTTDEVFDAFLDGPGGDRTFYHGHTYTANPLGCAAALASLEVFKEEDTLARASENANLLVDRLERLRGLNHVGDVRCMGMVGAVELVSDKDSREPVTGGHAPMNALYGAGLDAGIIIRPLGNVVYLFPPLSTTGEELTDMLDRFEAVIRKVC